MYSKIIIENFRGISRLDFNDLKQFNLIVGKNNSCKTTVLESIFLLTGPTNPHLPIIINALRGSNITNDYSWSLFFSQLNIESYIRLYGEIIKPEKNLYLIIKPLFETPILKRLNTNGPDRITSGQTESSKKLNGLSFDFTMEEKKSRMQENFSYQIHSDNDGKNLQGDLHIFQHPLKGIFIHANYGFNDNTRRFNEIQIKKQGKRILEIVQKFEPLIQDLSVGSDNILYCDVGFKELVPINMVGEGINRLLSIILAIYATSNGVVLFDEVENGFHYSALEFLWEAIFQAATEFNVQVFATTHSFENIKAYSSAYEKLGTNRDDMRLFRLEKEKEAIELISLDHELLKTTLENNLEIR